VVPADTAATDTSSRAEPVPSAPAPQEPTPDTPPRVEPAPQISRTGWLSITSDPAADVYVDERYIGVTPVNRVELTSGSHTLECRSPKHEAYREILQITSGEISSRNLVLPRLVGRITLSTIVGAEVLVDGVLYGVTPLEGPIELEAGRHQLTVKKAGFHVWNNSVTLEAKQFMPLRITLSPMY
jgi:serine/threonine-protein kinase